MICERCQDPNKTDVQEYTVTKQGATLVKGETKRKTVLCVECAEATRAVHKLTGGKAPEAEPSAPEPEATEDTSERPYNRPTVPPSRRRG